MRTLINFSLISSRVLARRPFFNCILNGLDIIQGQSKFFRCKSPELTFKFQYDQPCFLIADPFTKQLFGLCLIFQMADQGQCGCDSPNAAKPQTGYGAGYGSDAGAILTVGCRIDELEELDDIRAYDAAQPHVGDRLPFDQAVREIQQDCDA